MKKLLLIAFFSVSLFANSGTYFENKKNLSIEKANLKIKTLKIFKNCVYKSSNLNELNKCKSNMKKKFRYFKIGKEANRNVSNEVDNLIKGKYSRPNNVSYEIDKLKKRVKHERKF